MINKGPAKINILIENLPKASLTSFIGHILATFQVARKTDNDCELLGCRADGLHWKEWEEHSITETFFTLHISYPLLMDSVHPLILSEGAFKQAILPKEK